MTATERIPALLRDDHLWRRAGVGLGLGRVGLGLLFWRAPGASVRVAGLDAAQAPHADWLARMTAGRDVALGAGAAAAALRPDSTAPERAAWYAAGALVDALDAVAIRRGSREGRLSRVPATLVAVGASGAALAGAVAAGRELAVGQSKSS